MTLSEQKSDNSSLGSLLETQETAETPDISSLIGKEYRPNRLMGKLVSVLEHTMSEYESEPAGDSLVSRIYRSAWNTPVYSYLRTTAPYKYARKGIKNFLEMWVKSIVGGSTGDIMESAARYLEVRAGIKDDPVSYTKYSLIWIGVSGTIGLILTEVGIFALSPAAGIIEHMHLPQYVYNTIMIANPVLFVGDFIRRAAYLKMGKPSGPWQFELLNAVIKAGKNMKENYINPCIKDYLMPFMTKVRDEFSEFYNTQIEPRFKRSDEGNKSAG